MNTESRTLRGVIHGRTIELETETDLPEGQLVTVTVTVTVNSAQGEKAVGEGVRESAGGWSDDPEGVDEFIKWTYEQRTLSRPEIEV